MANGGNDRPQIAEWVIGSWLSSQHHFLRYAENQKQGFWEGPMAVDFEDSVGLRMFVSFLLRPYISDD